MMIVSKILDKKIIEWDYANWSQALNFWINNTTHQLDKSIALELGARNGGLSLWLALRGCRVVCSDLEGPTDYARKLHDEYKVSQKVEYQNIDATNIGAEQKYDIIIFKSVLGGVGRNNRIDMQVKCMNEIYKVLKPGGELLFAENLVASPLHRFFRKKYVRWGDEWRYVTPAEIFEFTSQFTSISYKTVGFLGAFGRTEWQRNVLGFFDRLLFNFIVPDSWKYIIIGIAQK
jgi:SAM-dependent methyltransferase